MKLLALGVWASAMLMHIACAGASEMVYEIWRGPTTNRSEAVPVAYGLTQDNFVDHPPVGVQTNFYWVRAVAWQESSLLQQNFFDIDGKIAVVDTRLQVPTVVKRGESCPLRIAMTVANVYGEEYYWQVQGGVFDICERDELIPGFPVNNPQYECEWNDPGPGWSSYAFTRTVWQDMSAWENGYPGDHTAEVMLKWILRFRWHAVGASWPREWQAQTPPVNVEIVDALAAAPPLSACRVGDAVYLAWPVAAGNTEFSDPPVAAGTGWELTLAVSPPGGGTNEGSGIYLHGTAVQISATAVPGYRFDAWSEDGVTNSTSAITTLVMTTNRVLTARFVKTWRLDVRSDPPSGGAATGGGTFDDATAASVAATPSPGGWVFAGWAGEGVADANSRTTTVAMTADRTVVARFTGRCELQISALPPSGGVVSGGGTYDRGTIAHISASPTSGYRFAWWKGEGISDRYAAATTVAMTKNRSVSGQFASTNGGEHVEYFFDSDPGYGNGIRAGDAFVADVSQLTIGGHTLYVRAQNPQTGEWGLAFPLPFVKELPPTEPDRIEWFFDSDPGMGLANEFSAEASDTEILGSNTLDCTALALGMHTLYVRGRNSMKLWGQAFALPFVKEHSIGTDEVNAVEFFVDHDPGMGQGIRFNVDPTNVVTLNAAFRVNDFMMGGHTLYTRGRNTQGMWGPTFPLPFSHELDCLVVPYGRVSAVRYFLTSNDVQVTDAVVLSNIVPAASIQLTFTGDVSRLCSGSNYAVHVEGISHEQIPGLERWSSFALDERLAVRGFNYAIYSDQDAYWSETAPLQGMKDMKANWVAIVPTWYQATANANSIGSVAGKTPSDSSVRKLIDNAHAAGLKVLLKPHVDCTIDGVWRGTFDPTDRTAWFTSYRAMIADYAALAYVAKVEAFSVGCEFKLLESDRAKWLDVITAVTNTFHGMTTYCANWDSFAGVSFWDQLDWIGIDAYFPIATNKDSTVERMTNSETNGWKERLASVQDWRASAGFTNKPVVFTEVGYRSVDGASTNPSDHASVARVDMNEQAYAFKALFRALHDIGDSSPFHGVLVWWWDNPTTPDYYAPPNHGVGWPPGYTPRGKLATDDIAAYFRGALLPAAYIQRPRPDASYLRGEDIPFLGYGTDRAGSTLGILQWQSQIDGVFGTTDAFVHRGLSEGCHTVTLYAVDGNLETGACAEVLHVLPDDNSNSLPDSWDQRIVDADPNDAIRSIADVNPNDDFDRDGLSNRGEWIAGTDPTDRSSVLNVSALGRSSLVLGYELRWPSVAGRRYDVLRTTNLSVGFLPLAQELEASPPENVWTDFTAGQTYYYRIRVHQ